MNKPDKIYVSRNFSEDNSPHGLWYLDKSKHDANVEYIRKDALLEWAKAEIELSKQVELVSEEPYEEGRQQVARLLINYLNSM